MVKQDKNKEKKKTGKEKKEASSIPVREGTTIREVAEKLNLKAKDLIQSLGHKGFDLSVNNFVDSSVGEEISKIAGKKLEIVSVEKQCLLEIESKPDELVIRPPVVTIMGHVDHGKTTLLDAIRESNIVGKESGGITQHIGAYRVFHKGRPITFIDTPGHEAFTRLRSRGAQLTDIVILVVAADDGVMPQTKEAINHARAAGVPILVAINKIDKKGANPEEVKKQLSKEGVLVEDFGGDVVSVSISAKEKKNLNELLEMLLLLADMIEIKANPNVKAQGVVLEARLDSKKGPLSTVIIQHGTLRQGEAFISGTACGKARALFDEKGKLLKEAEPSVPVEILGFSEVPVAGDLFQVTSDLEEAKKIAQFRRSQIKREQPPRPERLTLDELFKKIEEEEIKELPLIIKGDVQGSVEVLTDTLPSLGSEEVKIKIIHSSTGNITESDVLLASASNAIIIGYNVKPGHHIEELAAEEKVEIRTYTVIYQLLDDIKKALEGMLEPAVKETYLGKAEIRRIFNIPRTGVVAGCYVLDGKILRNAKARVIREKEVIHQGKIASLKHLKNDVPEVNKGSECGIRVENFKDIQEGDIIEAFITEKAKPG
ncbi:MAG: translation initiation factor IF-2 [Candidatus Aminicenantales bacterium]